MIEDVDGKSCMSFKFAILIVSVALNDFNTTVKTVSESIDHFQVGPSLLETFVDVHEQLPVYTVLSIVLLDVGLDLLHDLYVEPISLVSYKNVVLAVLGIKSHAHVSDRPDEMLMV